MSFGDDTLAPKDKSEIERDDALKRARGFQLMARNMAALIPKDAPGIYDFGRASGQVVCKKCGLEYIEHPNGMEPCLVLLCDGKQIKP